MINRILNHYWDICLLKETPEHTLYSYSLMILSGVLFILITAVQWSYSFFDFADDFGNSLLVASCMVSSYIPFTYVVLLFTGYKHRLVQTVTSLFCTHVILLVLISPLIILSPYLLQIHLNPLFLLFGIIYLFLSLGLAVWQFVINAHIYKYALNTSAIQSVLVAFGLVAVNILIVSLLR